MPFQAGEITQTAFGRKRFDKPPGTDHRKSQDQSHNSGQCRSGLRFWKKPACRLLGGMPTEKISMLSG
jgi:hypothetical protein